MRLHRCLLASMAILCLAPVGLIAAGGWEDDFEKAAAAAKAQNKFMLLDFSGSDWCGWCIRLDKEVFSKSEFKKYAKDNLVCVLIDFPRRKTLGKKQQQQNEKLRVEHGVRGFPTVVILSPDGKKVHQTGYQEGGAEKYVQMLESHISEYRKANDIADPVPAAGKQPRPGVRKPGADRDNDKTAEKAAEAPAAAE